MRMRARLTASLVALATLVALAAPVLGTDGARVDTRTIDGGRLITVVVPGVLLDTATGRDGLRLLTADDPDGPRRLWRLDVAAGTLEPSPLAPPPKARALAAAGGTLFLAAPGRLYRAGERAFELAVESRYLDLGTLAAGGFLAPGRVTVPELGALTTYVAAGGTGGWTIESTRELPVRAAREAAGLRLSTLPVTRLDLGTRVVHAVGPEAHGVRRLRTVLVSDDGETTEAWSWLPAPERVVRGRYAALGERAVLIVTTVGAESLGVFAKQRLRVFSLRAGDRSRAGLRPALKAETVSYHWHRVTPEIADADGDGRDDLVVVQPDGLAGKKLVVEAYPGRGGVQLGYPPLRSVVPAELPEAWRYGADVDGDGVADLVVYKHPEVQVFRGMAGARKKVLDRKAHRRIRLEPPAVNPEKPRELRAMETRDVDGDGRAEILVRTAGESEGILWVIDGD